MFNRTRDQEALIREATYWRRGLNAAVKLGKVERIHTAILAAPAGVDVVVDIEAAVIDANTTIGELTEAWREWAINPSSQVPVCEIDRVSGLLSTQGMFSIEAIGDPEVVA